MYQSPVERKYLVHLSNIKNTDKRIGSGLNTLGFSRRKALSIDWQSNTILRLCGEKLLTLYPYLHIFLSKETNLVDRKNRLWTTELNISDFVWISRFGALFVFSIIWGLISSLFDSMSFLQNEMLFCQEKEAAETCDQWCLTTLRKIREASPLSLKVILRSVSAPPLNVCLFPIQDVFLLLLPWPLLLNLDTWR